MSASDVSELLVDVVASLVAAGLTPVEAAPIGGWTTYRVGGAAAVALEIGSAEDLRTVARILSGTSLPTLVVGRGSNLLVADGVIPCVALRLGPAFEQIEQPDQPDWVVRVGGAASLPVVARRTVADGLGGFEWAVGVPGSIGGAVRMNAGGHGSDMAATVRMVRVVDLETGQDREMSVEECEFGYRSSAIRPTEVVVSVDLELEPIDPATGEAEIAEIVRWRRHHQPGGPNAGSVFTNPIGDSAGRLIDVAGCKGLRVGSAVVSMKHANFIQADPGGWSGDVAALMAEVRRRVAEHSGVELHAETVMFGFDPVVVEAAGGR